MESGLGAMGQDSKATQSCPTASSAPSAPRSSPGNTTSNAARAPGELRVQLVSGKLVPLVPEAAADDTVEELRQRVGAAVGVHQLQVGLLHLGREVLDGQRLSDIFVSDEGCEDVMTVTAVQMPCRVRPADYESCVKRYDLMPEAVGSLRFRGQQKGFVRLGTVEFPQPKDININMMPFTIGDMDSVPLEYRHYWPLVSRCPGLRREEGKIGFLTIQESMTPAGSSQRRPGVHTETPGVMSYGGKTQKSPLAHWGQGDTPDGDVLGGGIYFASSIGNSCAIWNAQVLRPEESVGRLGDIQHLRDFLGESETVGPGELIWLTDTTPHESLPLQEDTYRQFFRVVTSMVSVWFADHSTPNPLGIVPEPTITTIIHGNKFADEAQEVPLETGALVQTAIAIAASEDRSCSTA